MATSEIHEPGVLQTPKPRRKVRVSDIVIFVILAVVTVVLVITLHTKLVLKHDVDAAQIVSDKAIAALQKRDGSAAHSLGSSKFKSTYSTQQLTSQFKAVEIATLKAPALDRQIAYTSSHGRTIFFIYKYTALKVPYYVRTAIQHQGDKWLLTNISGSATESNLIVQ